jgi:hypothetical protein
VFILINYLVCGYVFHLCEFLVQSHIQFSIHYFKDNKVCTVKHSQCPLSSVVKSMTISIFHVICSNKFSLLVARAHDPLM